MINKIETYIFCHDQNIILDYIFNNKFTQLANVKYVFLGNSDIDKIYNLDNVIIARDLSFNIENYSKLTAFTGWYVLWKNNFIHSEYVNLFEYDVSLDPNFNDILKEYVDLYDIIGYIPLEIDSEVYIDREEYIDNFLGIINKYYNTDVKEFIKTIGDIKEISMTSNHTFKTSVFNQYMEWIEPMLDDFKANKMAGHIFERSISLFYLINNIPNITILKNILFHFQLDSHQTQGIYNEHIIDDNYAKLLNNDKR